MTAVGAIFREQVKLASFFKHLLDEWLIHILPTERPAAAGVSFYIQCLFGRIKVSYMSAFRVVFAPYAVCNTSFVAKAIFLFVRELAHHFLLHTIRRSKGYLHW